MVGLRMTLLTGLVLAQGCIYFGDGVDIESDAGLSDSGWYDSNNFDANRRLANDAGRRRDAGYARADAGIRRDAGICSLPPQAIPDTQPRCATSTLTCLRQCTNTACETRCLRGDTAPRHGAFDCEQCVNQHWTRCIILNGCADEWANYSCCYSTCSGRCDDRNRREESG